MPVYDHWSILHTRCHNAQVVKQDNFCDCGLFLCAYAEYFARYLPPCECAWRGKLGVWLLVWVECWHMRVNTINPVGPLSTFTAQLLTCLPSTPGNIAWWRVGAQRSYSTSSLGCDPPPTPCRYTCQGGL